MFVSVAMLINLARDKEDPEWRVIMHEKVNAYVINYGIDGTTLIDELDSAQRNENSRVIYEFEFARAVMILRHLLFGSIPNDRFREHLNALPFDQIYFAKRVSGDFCVCL
jgi:hypothetical protein